MKKMVMARLSWFGILCSLSALFGAFSKDFPGECPYSPIPSSCSLDQEDYACIDDFECHDGKKCCFDGCTPNCEQPVTRQKIKLCDSPLDLAILFDNTLPKYKRSRKTLQRTQKLVHKILRKVHVTPEWNHVALGVVSRKPYTLLEFNSLPREQMNTVHVLKRLYQVQKPRREKSRLKRALKMATAMFQPENGARKDSAKVLIIVSSGLTSKRGKNVNSLVKAAQPLKRSGVSIVTVGVGHVLDTNRMLMMSSREDHVWPTVNNKMINQLRQFAKRPCNTV